MRLREPVKPMRPSMTTSLRWLRRSGRCHCPFQGRSGSSVRQLHAISDEIEQVVKKTLGDRKLGREGYTEGGWVLLDYGDVVVHLFDDKSRDYYGLEDLWSDARRVPLAPELSIGAAE